MQSHRQVQGWVVHCQGSSMMWDAWLKHAAAWKVSHLDLWFVQLVQFVQLEHMLCRSNCVVQHVAHRGAHRGTTVASSKSTSCGMSSWRGNMGKYSNSCIRLQKIKGPDNPTSQFLPIMSHNDCVWKMMGDEIVCDKQDQTSTTCANNCKQVPGLPQNTQVAVPKRHACHAKRR